MQSRKLIALVAATATTLAGVTLGVVTAPPAAAATEVYSLPASGAITVIGKGGGHGHGMSQFGAKGRADAGIGYKSILGFYYPGTAFSSASGNIRVHLSSKNAPIGAAVKYQSGLALNGTGLTSAYSAYRLVSSKTSTTALLLAGLNSTGWHTIKDGEPATSTFAVPSGKTITVLANTSGSSGRQFQGTIAAYRPAGSASMVINTLSLEQYIRGVVPRESPASWNIEALKAQAVAARTYGAYERAHAASTAHYDVVDTTMDQEYDGVPTNISPVTADSAVSATAGQVLKYNGAVIFAQFTGSNGGYMLANPGFPYLVSKSDPYDLNSSNWYNPWTKSISVATIAADAGLARATEVDITQRDGHGSYGGRVLAGVIKGYTSSGAATSVSWSGEQFRSNWGLNERMFTIEQVTPGPARSLAASCGDASAWLSWTAPANPGASAITGYRVTVGSRVINTSAATRRVFVGPLSNGATAGFTIRARNGSGYGTAASTSCHPAPKPGGFTALPPARIIDTAAAHTPVRAGTTYTYALRGHAGVPTSATAAQIALTVAGPSASGQLIVRTQGVLPSTSYAVRYVAGRSSTVLLAVPLAPSGAVQFTPSAGTVNLIATRVGWSAPAQGGSFTFRPASPLPTFTNIGRIGKRVSLAARPGVTSTTKSVVLELQAKNAAATAGWVRVVADGSSDRKSAQLYLPANAYGHTTVIVPLSAARAVRVFAANRAIGVKLTVLGTVGPRRTGGKLESVPLVSNRGLWSTRAAFGVTTAARIVTLNAAPQVPTKGVRAVLVAITATGSRPGLLLSRPSGSSEPFVAVAWVNRTATSYTALLPLGHGTGVQLKTNGPAATVRIDTLGYVTAG